MEFMNGKLDSMVNTTKSFMLEAHAGASQEH